jgi:hypothetical protein
MFHAMAAAQSMLSGGLCFYDQDISAVSCVSFGMKK